MKSEADLDLAAVMRLMASVALSGEPLHLVIELNGRRVELRAWPCETAPAAELNDGDRIVLEAVAELGGSPNAGAVAAKSGFPLDSHLKMRLSKLRSRGFLGGARGCKNGYTLTRQARELLAEGPR